MYKNAYHKSMLLSKENEFEITKTEFDMARRCFKQASKYCKMKYLT
jgi:hypothetical protein